MGKVAKCQDVLLPAVELSHHLAQQADLALEFCRVLSHAVSDIWTEVFAADELRCLVRRHFEKLGSASVVIPYLSDGDGKKP